MATRLRTMCTAALMLAGMLMTSSALSDKPEWAGGSEKGKAAREHRDAAGGGEKGQAAREHRDRTGPQSRRAGGPDRGGHFRDEHRAAVRGYYEAQFHAGKCPPGLAKKRNGCMPPGQARKWQIGRPLPHDVVFYDVPPALVVQLGRPPAGYRYVRVASDILLIALGTGMVMDAIQDLGRM